AGHGRAGWSDIGASPARPFHSFRLRPKDREAAPIPSPVLLVTIIAPAAAGRRGSTCDSELTAAVPSVIMLAATFPFILGAADAGPVNPRRRSRQLCRSARSSSHHPHGLKRRPPAHPCSKACRGLRPVFGGGVSASITE